MKGCEALLLLLLCLSGTESQGHDGLLLNESRRHHEPADLLQPDLWGELKELRDMVVVQQEKMRGMEARVAASEEEAKKQGMFMAGKQGHG